MPARSPLLDLPGAVAADGLDAGVAWHYGDPLGEQRRLAAGAGLVDQSHLGVVTVTGPDRLSWLDTLSSQRLTGLAAGGSAEALLLDVAGHVEHDLRITDDGTTSWLVVESAEAAPLTAFLDSMRFMLRVEVADATARWAVVGQPSDEPTAEWAGSPLPVWVDPWPRTAPGGFGYAKIADADHPGAERRWRDVLVPRGELLDFALAAGRDALAGTWAAEALRVAARRPRLGAETDERTLPHEVDWTRTAVHLDKGCYKGQESVARVFNLGRPPRRLVYLQLDGSRNVLPRPGDEVVLPADGRAGRRVGRVTSVAQHFEEGPVALAVIKRGTPVGGQLLVVAHEADREVLVDATAETVVDPEGVGYSGATARVPLSREAGRREGGLI